MITVSKVFPSGAWQVSTLVDGYRFARTYMGYTKKESIQLFKEQLKENN